LVVTCTKLSQHWSSSPFPWLKMWIPKRKTQSQCEKFVFLFCLRFSCLKKQGFKLPEVPGRLKPLPWMKFLKICPNLPMNSIPWPPFPIILFMKQFVSASNYNEINDKKLITVNW
jgi:hypothetical protein